MSILTVEERQEVDALIRKYTNLSSDPNLPIGELYFGYDEMLKKLHDVLSANWENVYHPENPINIAELVQDYRQFESDLESKRIQLQLKEDEGYRRFESALRSKQIKLPIAVSNRKIHRDIRNIEGEIDLANRRQNRYAAELRKLRHSFLRKPKESDIASLQRKVKGSEAEAMKLQGKLNRLRRTRDAGPSAAALPNSTLISSPQPQAEADFCALCVESFDLEPESFTLVECGHFFHLSCLNDWLVTIDTCPLCQQRIRIIDWEN